MVQSVTSKPSDVGTLVRIPVQPHEQGFLLTKKKNAQQVENDWFVSTQNQLHGQRGKGKTESFSREKLRQARQKEGEEILCDPGWYVHKPDVQNKWDYNNTHTHRQEIKRVPCKPVAPLAQLVTSQPPDALGREFESRYLGFFPTKNINAQQVEND